MNRIRSFHSLLLLLVLAALLGGCTETYTSPPAPPRERQASVTPSSTATATPALPAPMLSDIPWDDRSVFEPGLIPSQRNALKELPGASVYHLDLTINEDMTHVSGKLEVRYTNTEDVNLNEIVFRLFPNILDGKMTVSDVLLNGSPTKTMQENQDSVLMVGMPYPLQPGDQAVISMNYQVEIPTTEGGNYAVLATIDGVMALAHAYPMIPAYDDENGWYVETPPNYGDVTYSDTAYYLVRASLPAGQTVDASGFEIDRKEQEGKEIITWAAGPMRDFYLVSSARYQVMEEKVGDTVVRAYAPGELGAENELALQYAIDALTTFNEAYEDYPFTELAVAGTPTTAGGVEYPGIVVVALSLYDEEQPFFEVATAHEVGHQWFYSVVGNDQIHHPWLDESLTQYNTMLYFGKVYGPAGYEEERTSQQLRWDYIDDADIPLDLPVAAYDEAEYSGIIYGRGGVFFDELRKQMGDDAFAKFQKDYYHTYKWGIATTDGLKNVAEAACNCDLTPLFEAWVYPK